MKTNFNIILAKLGRLVVSDRFWIGVVVVALTFLGMPEEVISTTGNLLDPEAQQWVLIAVKFLTLILTAAAEIISYGVRPTSGLGKWAAKMDVDVAELLKMGVDLSELMKKMRQEPSSDVGNAQSVEDVGEVAVKALIDAGADFGTEND